MKKRSVFLICIFAVICLQPYTVHAQFWKKIFGKGKKEKTEHRHHIQPSNVDTLPKKKKRTSPEFAATTKKDRYRIDVLIPLQLNTLVQNGKAIYKKPPVSVLPAVHFYEGLRMAVDTLNQQGAALDLYVHDISDPAHSISRLISDPSFKHTDLIIGFLQSGDLPELAAMAKRNHINLLSVLSPADADVTGNPYFVLIQPTLATHIDRLVTFALKKYPHQPKFIFYDQKTPVQQEALSLLKKDMGSNDYQAVNCSKATFSRDALVRLFDSTQENVIFMNMFAPDGVMPLLEALSGLSPAYHFAVLGMPSWKALNTINAPHAYPGVEIYYTNPFYYEFNSGPGIAVNQMYKKQYGGTPSEMVCRGYETLCWMADLLKKYGNVFNKNIDDISASPFTRYDVKPSYSEQNDFLYMENQKLYIFHYQNGYFEVQQ